MNQAKSRNDEIDRLLHEAVQGPDPVRRDDALRLLISFAERIAASRGSGHSESVAQSAVASVYHRIAEQKVEFRTTAELLGYLRQVAVGKVADRFSNDRRQLGLRLPQHGPDSNGNSHQPLEAVAETGDPVDTAGRRELASRVRPWLGQFPTALHPMIVDRVLAEFAASPDQNLAALLESLGVRTRELVAALNRTLALFPDQLRDRVLGELAALPYDRVPARLGELDIALNAARQLSPRDRLIVEMREAGWEPSDIAERIQLTANHVRVVHHRFRAKLFGASAEAGAK